MVKVSFKRKDFFIQLRREPVSYLNFSTKSCLYKKICCFKSEDYDTLLGFGMPSHRHAKALWKSCVEHHSFFRLKRPHRMTRFLNISLGSRFYYSGRTELQTVQECKQRSVVPKAFIRSPSKRLINGGSDGSSSLNGNKNPAITITKTSHRPHDNKVTSKQSDSLPRKAWEHSDNEEDGYVEQIASNYEAPLPLTLPSGPPAYSSENHTPLASICDSDNQLVTIKLIADDQGRYGFNVKGGIDLSLPIQVSKVVPHTAADSANPKICEGDEVVRINGRDVCNLRHEEVVDMIRSSTRDIDHGCELHLTVRPVHSIIGVMEEEEPLYQYVPETDEMGSQSLDGCLDDSFTQSLLLLNDGLASGSLLTQYEQMYRRNPDLAITEARKSENIPKNRYRDISPYDCTRVVLVNSDGDYINANYVNMEIPNGTVNRYIATQGPLATTTLDFWRMVQQESSHLVVMLTTVMEAGRQKCFQYWPVTGDVLQLTDEFSVKCLSEQADTTGSFVFREFILSDTKTSEMRSIQHMQYLAWPDHCVPSDPQQFLEFTEKVRNARSKTLLQEIEESLQQVRMIDDENGGLMQERKCMASNGETPEDETPVQTSVHQ